MTMEDILGELEQLTPEQFGYIGLAALIGPFVLRLFGFKLLARLIRPLAVATFAMAAYARQQQYGQS